MLWVVLSLSATPQIGDDAKEAQFAVRHSCKDGLAVRLLVSLLAVGRAEVSLAATYATGA